jgi:hypothetical protein
MWRLNKGLARELLPAAPPDIRMEAWWRVAVVNVGEFLMFFKLFNGHVS